MNPDPRAFGPPTGSDTPAQSAHPSAQGRMGPFVGRVLFVGFVVVLALLAWRLLDVFMLLFGALIVATALRSLSARLERYVGLSGGWAVGVAVLLVLTVALIGSWMIGARLAEQLDGVGKQLPAALEALAAWVNNHPLGPRILAIWETAKDGGVPWARVASAAGLTLGAFGSAGLILVLGVYMAANPNLYRDGVIRLIPVEHRDRVLLALEASGEGLSRWLMGQGISMLFVGASTAFGLMLLGMPLALSLGLIAGVLGFVPFFGPIASGLLAVLLASTEGATQALYVAGLCILIQQVEGNVLMPFVQRWAVSLPPVLGLVSVVIFGLLFGVMGVLFATPLMVVVMILVRKLYIEGVLGDRATQPG